MRIALVSTCSVAVPPVAYGGTELVVAELAKAFVAMGHNVTVFATGNSRCEGELRWHFATPVRPPSDLAELRHSAYAWQSIVTENPPFDVIHAHCAASVSLSVACNTPTVLTLHHDRKEELVALYSAFRNVRYVAISRRQAELVPEIFIRDVVHHGLDVSRYEQGDGLGGWLAFVGRFAQEKAPHLAIDAALAARAPLRMAGQPHWRDHEYFEREVKPRLARSDGQVAWHGELPLLPKLQMLRGARATLFPIQWEEPFGLVMIESMLVGTPVIAFARGAVPEIVEDGVTGFIVNDTVEMTQAVERSQRTESVKGPLREGEKAYATRSLRLRWENDRKGCSLAQAFAGCRNTPPVQSDDLLRDR